jgi:NADH-quinone oxidoreductase subunit E
MLRRLSPEQPASFAFTEANLEWARGQIAKYPSGRQASAVIPLLWRAQEQEGWVSRPAIEEVARLLGMAYIRVLEVATFYFMFQLQPVGSVAHVQVCGTTSCMICGAEDLIAVCREKIADEPFALSADGRFSWEEDQSLGACANAPMAQIGKDYYEDLTATRFAEILDAFARGEVPTPGPQNGRFASEPLGGATTLAGGALAHDANASVALARQWGDTVARITGAPLPPPAPVAPALVPTRPAGLAAPREGGADDLKRIRGVGPKLEALLHSLGFFHFEQIAGWTAAELAWVDEHLEGFHGRASRDDWVSQARVLAAGGDTEFSRRVDRGEVY